MLEGAVISQMGTRTIKAEGCVLIYGLVLLVQVIYIHMETSTIGGEGCTFIWALAVPGSVIFPLYWQATATYFRTTELRVELQYMRLPLSYTLTLAQHCDLLDWCMQCAVLSL